MQWPHRRKGEGTWRSALLQRLQEVRGNCKTRNQLYICYFNDRYDIDGETLKNKARYINHSCDPNCELQRTSRAIWVVALRDIREGEELTHRYNYEYDPEGYRDFPCFCGANNCVGYIVDQQYWELITQQRYQFAG
jgi:hypothetical protein